LPERTGRDIQKVQWLQSPR